MHDAVVYVALPYVALVTFVIGLVSRFRDRAFTVSSLSSQVLEDRMLAYGTLPWHFGIIVVLLGHALALAFPHIWQRLVALPTMLIAVEGIGLGAGLLTLVGLAVLIARRLVFARLRRVTTPADYVVLALLASQCVLGVSVAWSSRWGSVWATGTAAPYLWSLVTLQPRLELVRDLPWVFDLHVASAWLLVALAPYSRLVHAFVVPVGILVRRPPRAVWGDGHRFPGPHGGPHA
ncbi:MAG: respiratory nitrate reductase subunit gamma [Myxococcota bacterium]